MKLFLSPGACSLSPHIVMHEAGLKFTHERVNLKDKTTSSGLDYTTVNPKGYVPALQLDDGTVLTEGTAIVQYVADLAPGSKLAPPAGSMERYKLQEWLGYLNSEVHKSFSPLFNPATTAEAKQAAKDYLAKRFKFIEPVLAKQPYLLGDGFTVADAYLFTLLNWTGPMAVDLSPFPSLKAFQARVAGRPAVRQAMTDEGLLKG